MADQYALIRSVTHPDNTHTVAMHYMLTGVRHARPATNPRNAPDDFPCFGAVVNHVGSRRSGGGRRRASILPPAVSLNAPANQVSANNHIFPGFFAGQLGAGFDPMFVPQNADAPDFQPLPPLAGIERSPDRRRLLQALDGQARARRARRGRPRPRRLSGPGVRPGHLPRRPPGVRPGAGAASPSARATGRPRSARAACWPAGWSRRASRS